jgi:deoxyadenosine/deoxycytidine kinase
VSATPQKFIVVEGPIGVGKTSLARRLAQSMSAQLVLEQADQNPFLERFYKNPRAAAFQTQLFFLFQRARQLEEVRQEDLVRCASPTTCSTGSLVRPRHA